MARRQKCARQYAQARDAADRQATEADEPPARDQIDWDRELQAPAGSSRIMRSRLTTARVSEAAADAADAAAEAAEAAEAAPVDEGDDEDTGENETGEDKNEPGENEPEAM